MSETLSKIFPIIDHLYIFQNLEYEWMDFLKWFTKNLLKRNLQRKHKIEWTSKALLLLVVSLILIFLCAHLWSLAAALILLVFAPPIYLVLAQAIIYPLESYQKKKTLAAVELKLSRLPNLKVVAIVGSFAKTSTKNMLYTTLWKDFEVVKTPKSFNTPISVARTILSDIKPSTQIFIAEMDAYHPGDIKALCRLVKPDMGIITAIGAQHLGRFGSMEKLSKTQFELAENLPAKGVLFINNQDSESKKLSPNYSVKKIFFGAGGDFYATNIRQTANGTKFTLNHKNEKVGVTIPLLGTHNVSNFLAAAAIAETLGLDLKRIAERGEKILPTPHRLEVKRLGEMTIIDNTYNTNPTSSRTSLKLLADIGGSQKILITPGLVELGREHAKENIEFAKAAGEVASEIIIVGENARKELQVGLNLIKYPKNKIHLVSTTQEGMSLLKSLAVPGTVALIENDLPDQYS